MQPTGPRSQQNTMKPEIQEARKPGGHKAKKPKSHEARKPRSQKTGNQKPRNRSRQPENSCYFTKQNREIDVFLFNNIEH